jgi:ribosomal protein S18 acetylase RimI-like enzyme
MIQKHMKPEFKVKNFRKTVVPSDIMSVTQILKSTGFFKPHEIDVAVELIGDRLKNGEGCGYQFYFLEIEGRTVAYGCYGEIPCTVKNYDLYWLAVDNNYRSNGLGRILLEKIEDDIKAHSGRGIYIETSNKEQYKPTMAFYKKCDYQQIAVYEDFYDIGDNKAVFFKKL